MTVGEKIKEKRLELGWSQQQLADKMGFKDKTSISKIEKGKTKVDVDQLMQFAIVMNVPVSTFYKDPSPRVTETLDLMQGVAAVRLLTMYELFPRLTDEKQDLIIELMRGML